MKQAQKRAVVLAQIDHEKGRALISHAEVRLSGREPGEKGGKGGFRYVNRTLDRRNAAVQAAELGGKG